MGPSINFKDDMDYSNFLTIRSYRNLWFKSCGNFCGVILNVILSNVIPK